MEGLARTGRCVCEGVREKKRVEQKWFYAFDLFAWAFKVVFKVFSSCKLNETSSDII
jgi:hypothetical protein